MTTNDDEFDVIVIGGGPAGYVCAIRLAQLGAKVACIESRKALGGTCLNVGCIPSKALLESTHALSHAQKGFKKHGIVCKDIGFDLSVMMKRKDQVVSTITGGVDYLFKKNKVKRIHGWGSLVSGHEVQVEQEDSSSQRYKAKKIVIASGSVPIDLPFAPCNQKNIVNSTGALSLSQVPEHLIVVGAGVIGVELGSVWARLGSKVTYIEALDKALGATDKEVSTQAQKMFTKQGMTFHLESKVKEIKDQGSFVSVSYSSKDGDHELQADKVLVAIGRRPATQNMGLEQIGVEMQRGVIVTNDAYQSSIPSIYAVGDAITGPMLAHKASEEGVALAEQLLGHTGKVNYRAIPDVIYTWPEIASVGLSEEQCIEKGLSYKVGRFQFKANGRARAADETDGFVKLIADKQTDRLLGAHILGATASEMIGELVVAFEYGASAEDIACSVHAHPTLSESIKEAALDVDGRALHA